MNDRFEVILTHRRFGGNRDGWFIRRDQRLIERLARRGSFLRERKGDELRLASSLQMPVNVKLRQGSLIGAALRIGQASLEAQRFRKCIGNETA